MELEVEWSQLKQIILAKPSNNNIQCVDFGNSYTVILVDGAFTCFAKIPKEDPVVVDSDQEDFEDNFSAEVNNTIDKINPMDKYILQEVEEVGSTTYVGLSDSKGKWLVKKIVESGNDVTITYANISGDATRTTFALAWTNRATLTYGLIESLNCV